MKKFLLFLAILITSITQAQIKQVRIFRFPSSITGKDYMPGIIVIKFKAAVISQTKIKRTIEIPVITIKSAKIVSLSKKFIVATTVAGTSTLQVSPAGNLERIYELHIDDNSKLQQAINELLLDDNIEYAEPEYIYRTSYTPNDPNYVTGNQAYLNLVMAPQAWDIIKNAPKVIIGIVDSGSDLTHEDLAANIYVNAADPINGLDDDKDGYVDNYYGWDLIGRSGSNPMPDNDPNVKSDTTDHGVHVSGIAGAVTDNGIGGASISFNTAKLLIVKCGADNDGSSIYKGYEGIVYAVNHGAQIINCSWGGTGGSSQGQDVIDYAISKGVLVIAAAGNSNTSNPEYPAAYKGVLAIANVQNTDVRSPSSNYGSYVSMAAPGTSILNTTFHNQYKRYSGTSMASPMVASAASLVKARFPLLNMEQVGQKLRATADDIDAKNPSYAGQLGKGRINVYRALTESSPSIRKQNMLVIDKGLGTLPAGDTLTLYFDLKNFLDPISNVSITLSTTNSNVTIPVNSITLTSFASLDTKTRVGPFKVYIKPSTPDNTTVIFRIQYSGNSVSYQDFETFDLIVSLDYQSYKVNQVATTITSNGRLGFSAANAANGQGFQYKDQDLLFEASLMIGNSDTKLSDNTRSANGNSNEDFLKKVRVSRVLNTTAAFEAKAEFDDSNGPNRVGVYVKNRHLAYATAPDDKYIITEYEVKNTTAVDLTNVYVGMFTDWDIDLGSNNVTSYDAINNFGYVYSKAANKPYAGVKLLAGGLPGYYPLSYMVQGDPLKDDNFTKAEKYLTLSSGMHSQGLGENITAGYDVMFVTSGGPLTIPANQTVKVAFAYIGGDNLADLQASAKAAQNKYQSVVLNIDPALLADNVKIIGSFPNPAGQLTKTTVFQYAIPEKGMVNLNLYTINGQLIKSLSNATQEKGVYSLTVNTNDLKGGVYFFKLDYNNIHKTSKLVVIH